MMDESTKAQLPGDKSLSGVFTDRRSAELAYDLLQEMGYFEDEVSVLMSDEARVRYFPSPEFKGEVIGDTIQRGPGFGGVVGVVAGTALGGLLGAAASLIIPGPGVGVVGPLATVLLGAAVGGVSGVLLGSLLGIGSLDKSAKKYGGRIKQGNVIIAVNPISEEDAEKISREWRTAGGEIFIQ
jgi:hypothetical protein